MKILDKAANLAIIVAVAVFLLMVARHEFTPRASTSTPPSTAMVGATIRLPGIRFPAERYSLVIGISSSCHFCSESLPFYKQLTGQLQGRINMIAVLPQSQSEAEKYITSAGLGGTQVVSANLATIGVYATPTLLLVDGAGKIKSEWVGKLDEADQNKVLAAVLQQNAQARGRN